MAARVATSLVFNLLRFGVAILLLSVAVTATLVVPFRVRFDNNNTIRTLELSLQAAGTDG